MSQPWIAYGQTLFKPNIQNPPCLNNGLLGECHSFPYTVPVGKILKLTTLQIEPLWGAAMIPWIGDFPCTTEKGLATVASEHRVIDAAHPANWNDLRPAPIWHGFNYQIPAGLKLNLFLSSNPAAPDGVVYAWYMGGELLDA